LNIIDIICVIVFCVANVRNVYRMKKGPNLYEPGITIVCFGVTLIGMMSLVSIVLDTTYLLSVIMLIGMIGFIGTVGFAKFLEKGVIIENDRDNNSQYRYSTFNRWCLLYCNRSHRSNSLT